MSTLDRNNVHVSFENWLVSLLARRAFAVIKMTRSGSKCTDYHKNSGLKLDKKPIAINESVGWERELARRLAKTALVLLSSILSSLSYCLARFQVFLIVC